MKNEDRSYEQYRLNRYRYEQEQIIFPASVILGLAALISLWKCIWIAIAVTCLIEVLFTILYCYLKKQLKAEQAIFLSKEDAKEGVEAKINVTYNSQKVSFVIDIPPNVKDCQEFLAKNIVFEKENGKKVKKDIHFKIEII